MLACKKMRSPYVPDINVDNFDQNHVNNQEWKDADAVKESEAQLRRDSVQKLFETYYFSKHDTKIAPAPGPNPNHFSTKATTQGVPTTNGNDDAKGMHFNDEDGAENVQD